MSEELKPCPFCGKPFVLHQPKAGVTAFQHYSEDCPLHEREMQFVNLPMEKMIDMLNTRPVEDQLRAELQAAWELLAKAYDRIGTDWHEWNCKSEWVNGAACDCGGDELNARITAIVEALKGQP